MNETNSPMIFAFCLAAAAMGNYRTIYHDRIDGLLMPVLVNPAALARSIVHSIFTAPPAA